MYKNLKHFIVILSFFTIILTIMLTIPASAAGYGGIDCDHETHYIVTLNESTCDINGTEHQICNTCGWVLLVIKNAKLEHEMSDFVITVPATPNNNGVQESTCKLCGYIYQTDYICPHAETTVTELSVADCENVGVKHTTCNECSTILQVEEFPALGHEFGDWYTTKYATPFESGREERICNRCGHAESQSYSISMASNSIYIPGTGINGKVVPCGFTQANCDAYDMIYTSEYWGVGPWIIGHNTRTLGKLSRTKVGQNIYVSINGNIRMYKVFVSEKGTQNASHTNITCDYSGYSIFDEFGCETLRMYTCYGGGEGRWVVFAKRVS